jgi:hypothetical protein
MQDHSASIADLGQQNMLAPQERDKKRRSVCELGSGAEVLEKGQLAFIERITGHVLGDRRPPVVHDRGYESRLGPLFHVVGRGRFTQYPGGVRRATAGTFDGEAGSSLASEVSTVAVTVGHGDDERILVETAERLGPLCILVRRIAV